MSDMEPGDCKGNYNEDDEQCAVYCLIKDACIALTKKKPKTDPVKTKSTSSDFEVECINAVGLEDSFDEGITYIAEPHTDQSMIYVYDRNGQKRECFRERFKYVRTIDFNTLKFREPKAGDKVKIIGEPKPFFKHKVD